MNRVVVTGVGAIGPCGNTAADLWENVFLGKSGIDKITHFDVSNLPVQIAGEVKGFDPKTFFTSRELRKMDRFSQFARVASAEAIADAGLPSPLGERVGVYIGSGIGGVNEIAAGTLRLEKKGPRGLGAFFITRSLPNLAGGLVAIHHGAQGPNLCISTACAAGTHSIGEAFRIVRAGVADAVVAGGTEAPIGYIGLSGFMVMRALTRFQGDPKLASRPFDVSRSGFVISEGAGIVVLESLSHALARNATIYAEMIGYGQTNDAFHVSSPPPRHEGASRCMRLALDDASINLEEVGYINAHGTSTQQNDANECLAIHDVFGRHANQLLVSSTKGVTGHLLGAAGGVEAVITILALHNQKVPPTANLEHPDPDCNLDLVAKIGREHSVRVALSNSFGFGGANATLAFRKWEK